ncbi:transposase [Radiobacillus sp. PE A8.2]|uniref:transposase n=1 Tax=Radiobacillus sp. PE A8.2 TaxID=3380349 RepID=UPI0038910572
MAVAKKQQRYSKEIKLKAIRRVLEEDEAVQTVVDELGIRNRTTIMSGSRNIKRMVRWPLIVP